MYEYSPSDNRLVSVYEYLESKGYEVKVTDTEDGTLIFIKEKPKWMIIYIDGIGIIGKDSNYF